MTTSSETRGTTVLENSLIWFGAGVSLAEILTGTYFASLGFSKRPVSAEEVKSRYRQLAKVMHPDAGGDADAFQLLGENYRKCLELMEA